MTTSKCKTLLILFKITLSLNQRERDMGKRGKGKPGKQLTGKDVELSEEEQKILDEAISEQLRGVPQKVRA